MLQNLKGTNRKAYLIERLNSIIERNNHLIPENIRKNRVYLTYHVRIEMDDNSEPNATTDREMQLNQTNSSPAPIPDNPESYTQRPEATIGKCTTECKDKCQEECIQEKCPKYKSLELKEKIIEDIPIEQPKSLCKDFCKETCNKVACPKYVGELPTIVEASVPTTAPELTIKHSISKQTSTERITPEKIECPPTSTSIAISAPDIFILKRDYVLPIDYIENLSCPHCGVKLPVDKFGTSQIAMEAPARSGGCPTDLMHPPSFSQPKPRQELTGRAITPSIMKISFPPAESNLSPIMRPQSLQPIRQLAIPNANYQRAHYETKQQPQFPMSQPKTAYSHMRVCNHWQQQTQCPHTQCPHTQCPHTQCPHTQCPHTQPPVEHFPCRDMGTNNIATNMSMCPTTAQKSFPNYLQTFQATQPGLCKTINTLTVCPCSNKTYQPNVKACSCSAKQYQLESNVESKSCFQAVQASYPSLVQSEKSIISFACKRSKRREKDQHKNSDRQQKQLKRKSSRSRDREKSLRTRANKTSSTLMLDSEPKSSRSRDREKSLRTRTNKTSSTLMLYSEPNFMKKNSKIEVFYDCRSMKGSRVLKKPKSETSNAFDMEDSKYFHDALKKLTRTSQKLLQKFEKAIENHRSTANVNRIPDHQSRSLMDNNNNLSKTSNVNEGNEPLVVPIYLKIQSNKSNKKRHRQQQQRQRQMIEPVSEISFANEPIRTATIIGTTRTWSE